MLGVLAELGSAWATTAETVVFGAPHAAVAPGFFLAGVRRSSGRMAFEGHVAALRSVIARAEAASP